MLPVVSCVLACVCQELFLRTGEGRGREGVSSHFFFFLGLFSLVCFGVSLSIQSGLSFHPQSDDAHVADLIGS